MASDHLDATDAVDRAMNRVLAAERDANARVAGCRDQRMGEEIAEGDWERFSGLEHELTTTVRRLSPDS